jgi:hypothetical protein
MMIIIRRRKSKETKRALKEGCINPRDRLRGLKIKLTKSPRIFTKLNLRKTLILRKGISVKNLHVINKRISVKECPRLF